MRLVNILKSLQKKKKTKKETKDIKSIENKLSYLKKLPKTYDVDDIEVRKVFEEKNGKKVIKLYLREKEDEDNHLIIRSTRIDNEGDEIKYKVNILPAGRVCFGGYLENTEPENLEFYSLRDVWYKTTGKIISDGARYTMDELFSIEKKMEEQYQDAHYDYLFEVKYKNSYKGKRKFEGSRYVGRFSKCMENNLKGEPLQKGFEDVYSGNITKSMPNMDEFIIDVADKYTHTSHFLADVFRKRDSKDSQFETILLADVGKSRVFNRYQFTKTALRQIAEDYEKKKERGEK